jgi:hypothetical protein
MYKMADRKKENKNRKTNRIRKRHKCRETV